MKCRMLLAGLFGMLTATAAGAQDFPTRPITIIVPFAAGGGADVQTRIIADGMSKELGQPVIVENRPGATGNVGLEYVSTAAPDGYTLLSLSNITVVSRNLQDQPFDLPKMMTPVANFLITPTNIIVNPNKVPVTDLSELVEHVKANPGLTFSSAGRGDGGHLTMTLFKQTQQLDMIHVAYRGTAPALAALIGGEIDMMVIDGASLQPQLDAPEVRVIGGNSSRRNGVTPDIPTGAEQGFPELSFDPVLGLTAPPGTPRPIIDRLAQALKVAAEGEAFTSLIGQVGNSVHFLDTDAFGAQLADDFARWGQVIRDNNITAE